MTYGIQAGIHDHFKIKMEPKFVPHTIIYWIPGTNARG
jgi:hypothetical protein